MTDDELARFMGKVNTSGECWEWTAARYRDGYGEFYIGQRMRAAHRIAYEHFVGPIPEGLVLDHLCRVRHCVNPAHLEAVTRSENAMRGLMGRLVTHCPQGHPYDETNTIGVGGDKSRRGHRRCRTCAYARQAIYRSTRRAELAAKQRAYTSARTAGGMPPEQLPLAVVA